MKRWNFDNTIPGDAAPYEDPRGLWVTAEDALDEIDRIADEVERLREQRTNEETEAGVYGTPLTLLDAYKSSKDLLKVVQDENVELKAEVEEWKTATGAMSESAAEVGRKLDSLDTRRMLLQDERDSLGALVAKMKDLLEDMADALEFAEEQADAQGHKINAAMYRKLVKNYKKLVLR